MQGKRGTGRKQAKEGAWFVVGTRPTGERVVIETTGTAVQAKSLVRLFLAQLEDYIAIDAEPVGEPTREC